MAHIEELLSTSLHGSTLSFIIKELMKDDLHQHSRDLDWLRRRCFEVHEFTILGKMRALAPLVTKKPIPLKDMEKVAKIIANHLKCFAIRTAQELATMVGSMYTNPNHDCYAGFNKWKSTSHVVLTTIAGPATTLQRLIDKFLTTSIKDSMITSQLQC
jgi:hypothetical protein